MKTSRLGGGKDIWASTFHSGNHLIALVECKVRDNKLAIDPAIARAVVGTYFIEKNRGIDVDCALLVTSSDRIGRETVNIDQELRQFSLKDCDDVVDWIQQYGRLHRNLWAPNALAEELF